MTVWGLICEQCDHTWTVDLDEMEHPDDAGVLCPECGSDDYEAELPRTLPWEPPR